MGLPQDQLLAYLREAFPDAVIDIKDLAGDNDHYEVNITSRAFRGKSRIEQHQMVYNALQGNMGTRLHALALKTHVPPENT